MKILVINCGSSSVKYQVIERGKKILRGLIDGIGTPICNLKLEIKGKKIKKQAKIKSYDDALKLVYSSLKNNINLLEIKAIGHRVVHGGEKYKKSIKINKRVIQAVKKYSSLVPLHNPINLQGIRFFQKKFKNIPNVAVFDTAFHQTIPKKAFLYAIPPSFYKKHSIRRFGFHGISHQYIVEQVSKILKKKNSKIVSCHLGNGSSVTGSYNGKSIYSSLGFTALDGVIMGTRSGAIDPGVILYLLEKNYSRKRIHDLLYLSSGLMGICGQKDLRSILKMKKNKKMKLAIEMLCHSISKFVGSAIAVLNGIDALVFTGGIGENSWLIREKVCNQFSFLGTNIDKTKNKKNARLISKPSSKIKVFIIKTDEEEKIAEETEKLYN